MKDENIIVKISKEDGELCVFINKQPGIHPLDIVRSLSKAMNAVIETMCQQKKKDDPVATMQELLKKNPFIGMVSTAELLRFLSELPGEEGKTTIWEKPSNS